jgi:signal transduction histidine kinase
VVKEETDHLAAIVDDFLKFARPKKPMFQAEDLNQLLHDVVRRHKDMGRTDVDWVEAYDDGLPEVHLDRHQIQQVITNLLLNSLDAMPNGGTVRVSTRLLGADGGGGFVDVTVSDSGVGISGEELSRIFQPFYSTKEKGTGMGLAICRRIVGEHEGEITVKSEPWKGSAFSVLLPLKPKNDIKNGWESDHVGYPSDR